MAGPQRQLNLGKAWTDATTMLAANRDTILVLAGLFFFMPYLAMAMFVPEAVNPAAVNAPEGTDPEVVMQATVDAILAQYTENWLVILLSFMIYFIGSLAILALLRDRARPTVADAIVTGVSTLPTYLVSLTLVAFLGAVAVMLPVWLLGQILPPAAMLLIAFLATLAVLYLTIRFTLVMPVIAIEGQLNPIQAMRKSWELTAGNAMRLLAFLLLLSVAVSVISILFVAVFATVFAAFDEGVANIGNGLVNGLVTAVLGALFMAIYAAIHHQLAGPSAGALGETFE